MKLFYYKDPHGNFGDDLNMWLWERLIPGFWDSEDDILMSGIGTIIGRHMPPAKNWVIFSSGTGYSTPPKGFGGSGWHIVSVRGPLSARILGLPSTSSVTDGAILLGLLPEYSLPVAANEQEDIIFMPHYGALRFGKWENVCNGLGIHFINPCSDNKSTLEKLRRAKLVLADAMHAAIVADTFRIPWIPLTTSDRINSFKWLDWTQSMEIPYEPFKLPASSFLEWVQGLIIKYLRADYKISDLKNNTEIDSFYTFLRWREVFWGPAVRRISNLALTLLEKILSLPLLKQLHKKLDTIFIEKAAMALKAASLHPPSLSHKEVFNNRKNEMMLRLEEVKKLAVKLKKQMDYDRF